MMIIIAMTKLLLLPLSSIATDYYKEENVRAEQRLQEVLRIKADIEHSRQLDVEAQKVIDNASPVSIRIMEASPTLDTCRTVIWQVPASLIQTPKTAEASPDTVYLDGDSLKIPGGGDLLMGDYARTSPVVQTDFTAAHDYIVSHPELVPVIEPGCKPGLPEDAVKVNSSLFPKGTVAMGLPY
jgi:hypothetical protein